MINSFEGYFPSGESLPLVETAQVAISVGDWEAAFDSGQLKFIEFADLVILVADKEWLARLAEEV